jgi:hypothetical protein
VAARGIKVKGLRETARAFDNISDNLSEELTDGLKHAAEPVRAAAEKKAVAKIVNMDRSPAWAEQKTVVSKRTALVYIAPKKRQTRKPQRKRKNLAELMMGRAMEPALDENEDRVREEVDDVLNRLSRKNGF